MYFSKIIIKFLIILLRVSAFYVLLWIRIPLVLICEGVTSLSAVAFCDAHRSWMVECYRGVLAAPGVFLWGVCSALDL